MSRDNAGRRSRRQHQLVKLDLAAHGFALLSCAIGGLVVESIILMASASHHLASMGLRMLIRNEQNDRPRRRLSGGVLPSVQLILWTGCLLTAFLVVTAKGVHGLFHAEPLDLLAMAGFAVPGVVAAVTTAALAYGSVSTGQSSGRADALLSAMPTAIALLVASSNIDIDVGRMDALAGLALVLMLCLRTLIQLGRALD